MIASDQLVSRRRRRIGGMEPRSFNPLWLKTHQYFATPQDCPESWTAEKITAIAVFLCGPDWRGAQVSVSFDARGEFRELAQLIFAQGH